MKNIGGSSAHDLIQKILSSLISDEVLCDYSFRGQKSNVNGEKNKSFSSLILCSCIYREFSFYINIKWLPLRGCWSLKIDITVYST